MVIFPSDAKMTHEERVRMARLIKQGEDRRAASATVILAEGLLAAMQRGMLTGLMMIAPAPHPAKVFSQVDDALQWLAPHAKSVCRPPLSPAQLRILVGENVAAFRARKLSASA